MKNHQIPWRLAAPLIAGVLCSCSGGSPPQNPHPVQNRAPAGAASTVSPAGASTTSSTPQVELQVLAAASLKDAFTGIGHDFEVQHPGTRVTFSFAASSLLRTQVQQGIPADVFASADAQNMDPLVKAGLAAAPRVFAHNRLVIVTPADNPRHIHSLGDLGRPGVRLVLTDPAVPIGRYTRQALERAQQSGGYGPDFEARVMRNVVSFEPNVRSLLTKAEMGETDAAVVYASDALSAGSKVQTLPIPDRYNVIANYPIAVLKNSRSPQLAGTFIEYVLSSAGQKTLARWGFGE